MDALAAQLLSRPYRGGPVPSPKAAASAYCCHNDFDLHAAKLAGHWRLFTVLPLTMLRHRSNEAWLRALDVDLGDSSSPIAAITLRRRHSGGAVRLFLQASVEVCKGIIGAR